MWKLLEMIKVSVEEDPDDYEVLEDFDEASVAEDINAVNEDYLS